MNHIRDEHATHGWVALCGRADWDDLVLPDSPTNECNECASIAGVELPADRPEHLATADTRRPQSRTFDRYPDTPNEHWRTRDR